MMNDTSLEGARWRATDATGGSKAVGHAWVEFKSCPAGIVVLVNERPALRLSIRYRDSGPYIAVEVAPGSNETMGSCKRTATMVRRYAEILEAHNALGEILQASRSFVITDEERALARSDELAADKQRLDWLDDVNKRTNDRVGTTYGWRFDVNHNRAALTDHNIPALSVRDAIDEARKR